MKELPIKNNESCPMRFGDGDLCPHSLEGILQIIGKPWNIMIIGTIGNHRTLRFNELKTKLGNISPKTLTSRLKYLEQKRFIIRTAYAEIPPRVEYSLSKRAMEFYNLLRPIVDWSKKYDHQD